MERNLRPEVEMTFKVTFRMSYVYIYKPIHENCPSRTFPPRMTAGGFREADPFLFVFIFDVLLMMAEMVWGLKKQG